MSDITFYDTISKALAKGIKSIKLYFMIGLPDETDKDISSIADMLKNIYEMKSKSSLQITASVSQFVPKAKTIFENRIQENVSAVQKKLNDLKHSIPKGIILQSESPKDAFVQGFLAKEKRNVSKILTNLNGETSYSALMREIKGEGYGKYFN